MEQNRNKDRKRRGEEEENRPDGEDRGNMPRFNFTWVYVILALALLGLQLYKFTDTSAREINWEQFETFAKRGLVHKLEIVNKEEAYVYVDTLRAGGRRDTSIVTADDRERTGTDM